MRQHRDRYGCGGNCFDLAYWLLRRAREAGVPASIVGHDFSTSEAHVALVLLGVDGFEYLADPGDVWLQPILISPQAPQFDPGYHAGFFPAAGVRVDRHDHRLVVRYRRANGKESSQTYSLASVSEEAFLQACNHSQNLLRKPMAEMRSLHPDTGELGHWEYAEGKSWWSLPSGLLREEPCSSAGEWAARIAGFSGLSTEVIEEGFEAYGRC